MLKKCSTLGFLLVATLVAVGCAVTKTGLEAREQKAILQPQAKAAPEDAEETYDDLLLRVAQQAPAFGGMFFEFHDRHYTGVLYIYLLDFSQEAVAKRAIMTVFGPLYPELLPPREIRLLQAHYSFLQLKGWFDLLGALHTMPEVTMTDIDDAKNRLTIGLKKMDTETVSLVEQELAKLGIPREAVILEETGLFLEDRELLIIAQALDKNSNGFLDDLEIMKALDLWTRQVPVPDINLTISDVQLLELLEIWQARKPWSSIVEE
jgi:hypothetical protein